jgi:predicted DNA-binding transcriptional regulator AlpA
MVEAGELVGAMLKQVIALLERIERATAAAHMRDRWWSAEDIGVFLNYSTSHVRERVACRPDFPKALRLGDAHPRWNSAEVREWAHAQRDRDVGKPRRIPQGVS